MEHGAHDASKERDTRRHTYSEPAVTNKRVMETKSGSPDNCAKRYISDSNQSQDGDVQCPLQMAARTLVHSLALHRTDGAKQQQVDKHGEGRVCLLSGNWIKYQDTPTEAEVDIPPTQIETPRLRSFRSRSANGGPPSLIEECLSEMVDFLASLSQGTNTVTTVLGFLVLLALQPLFLVSPLIVLVGMVVVKVFRRFLDSTVKDLSPRRRAPLFYYFAKKGGRMSTERSRPVYNFIKSGFGFLRQNQDDEKPESGEETIQ